MTAGNGSGSLSVTFSNTSIGSVSGAVGSVTGAVGSVTAGVTLAASQHVIVDSGSVTTVTGNVNGSVASVTGAIGSVTGTVGSVTAGVTLAASQHVIVDSGSVTTVTGNVQGNVQGSVASVAGNVGGSVASVTNAVVLPSIPAGWITAAGINAGTLNGKGDWATYNAGLFTGAFTSAVLVDAPSGSSGGTTAVQVRQEMDANSTQLQRIAAKTDAIQSGLITIAGKYIGGSPVEIFTGGTIQVPLADTSGNTWPDLVATGAAVELCSCRYWAGCRPKRRPASVTGTVLAPRSIVFTLTAAETAQLRPGVNRYICEAWSVPAAAISAMPGVLDADGTCREATSVNSENNCQIRLPFHAAIL